MSDRVFVDGQWLKPADADALKARLAAELADDSVVYLGRGKNRDLFHLIAGKAKGQHQPLAVCGQWVSNRKTVPTTERICQKCSKGHRTSFSTFNQPRDCAVCGRKFADSASRDSNSDLCPSCYETAGIENEHQDGEHEGRIVGGCPMCEDDLADASVTATGIETPIPSTETETDDEPATLSLGIVAELATALSTTSHTTAMRALAIRRAMRDYSKLSVDLETAERTDAHEAGMGRPERVRSVDQKSDDERAVRELGLTLAKLLLEHHVPG